ncbi:MAG: SDR family NAD(P)-dependent oxidoreductase [Eggerthellaceae bacterium]|nr:SDR family NAD(P)-dependent oxidoreductase [Eggerthellaceae bacterium]
MKQIAVITGASSGIGEEFARAVSEFSLLDELWVIARRKERLEALAKELPHKIVRPFALDLTKRESFRTLREALGDEDVNLHILINDAGVCHSGPFDQMSIKDIDDMMAVDVYGMTMLNKVCIPYMNRGSYAILVSSVSSFAPIYDQAVYSAAKAYVRFQGEILHAELKKKGINVMVLCPGNVDTEMNPKNDASNRYRRLPYLNIKKLTRKSLKRAKAGKRFYTPGWVYKVFRFLSKFLPGSLITRMSR